MTTSNRSATNEALCTEIARNALFRELRTRNVGQLRRAACNDNNDLPSSSRKKRSRLEGDDEDSSLLAMETKLRCRRTCNTTMANGTFGTTTFLNLTPPAASSNGPITFTFGRQHYTNISLSALAKSSCACTTAGISKFDVFSAYCCPCKTKKVRSCFSKSKSNTMITGNASSSKVRDCEAF